MTLFDWCQAAADAAILLALGLHRHPVYWRGRWRR